MSKLTELIAKELQGKDFAQVDVKILLEAAKEHPKYTSLVRGLFVPEVGVMGEWSDKEKQEVRRITDAHQRAHSYSAGFRDASEERYRAAYERLSRMTAGDIARVRVGQTDYLMAAFPADWPERCLVLFVK